MAQSITGINFNTREFERALEQISRESDRTDHEIITFNARTYVRAIVYNTPRDTGAGRAGFWPAWEALEMPGSPGTRRGKTPFTKKKQKVGGQLLNVPGKPLYVPQGKVVDNRRKRGAKSFEFVNKTHMIRHGKKLYYLYVLNARTDFWGKGAAEAAFKFGRGYEKLLRKHSKI